MKERWNCARCDFHPDEDLLDANGMGPREQLAEHAHGSGHPLCQICPRSLTTTEPVTCERCLTEARRLLSEIVTLYALLPAELARLRSGLGSFGGGGGSDDVCGPLPGGNALILMSSGSEGLDEDGLSTRDGDPVSVSYELAWWAGAWQDLRGDHEPLGHRPGVTVRKAGGYLERRCRWAADEHPGFPAFHEDLVRIHDALERVTGRALRHARANADCFDCGGQLVRLDDPDGGLSNKVTCRRCHRAYTSAEYLLALRAAGSSAEGWVTVTEAAAAAHRSMETVETWVKRGLLEVACRLSDKRRVVWWPTVEARAARRTRRTA